MNYNEYMLDWYESHILLPNDKNKRICPYCNQIFGFKSWQKHMEEIHHKSIEEMLEECCFYHPLPLCANSKCNEPMTLVRPGNILGGLREFCSKQCAGERASQRLKDPAKSAKLRKILSERMTRMNNDPEYQDKKWKGFREHANRPRVFNRSNMRTQYTRTKKDILIIYLLEYGSYVKVGVSSDPLSRVTHLYGFKKMRFWEPLDKVVALSIEYYIKNKYDTYKGELVKQTDKTEVFPIINRASIIKDIDELIESKFEHPDLTEWIKNKERS